MYRHTHTHVWTYTMYAHTHTQTQNTYDIQTCTHTHTDTYYMRVHIIACFSSLFIIYFKLLSTMVLPLWVSNELVHGTVSSESGNHKTNCLASNMKSYPHTESHTHTHIYYTHINVHAIGIIHTHTERQYSSLHKNW